MDRPIDATTRIRERSRSAIPWLIGIVSVAVLLAFLPGWIRPSVQRDRIRTAMVERGLVEATITATGLVLPRNETVISSPSQSRVMEILRQAGDEVTPGTPIVRLDVGESQLSYDRLERQIALKRNERNQARIELENQLADLTGQEEIKALELRSFEYSRERNRKLFEKGLIVEDAFRQSETDAARAAIELRHLAESKRNARRALQARLKALDLESQILQKELEEAAQLLGQGTASSDRAGIVTWVTPTTGVAVGRGDEVARVADLSSFKVEATLSDTHAEKIRRGLLVSVRAGDHVLRGAIDNVLPTVENGTVRFEVALDQPAHSALRHNLRVDAHIIVDRRESTLRTRRGSFVNIDGVTHAFVVRGDVAVRTSIELGITNFEAYEIVHGLVEGDEVVLSDMSDYRNNQEVRIK